MKLFTLTIFFLLYVITNIFAAHPTPHKLKISESDAITLGTQNSLDIKIAKLEKLISKTKMNTTLSLFDLLLEAESSYTNNSLESSTLGDAYYKNDYENEISLTKKFTTGTEAVIKYETDKTKSNASTLLLSPYFENNFSLSITQNLAKNIFGLDDKASIDIAEIEIANEILEAENNIEKYLFEIIKSYWNIVLNKSKVKIIKNMLDYAKTQVDIYSEKLKLGSADEADYNAVLSSYLQRKRDLNLAKSILKNSNNIFLLKTNLIEKDLRRETLDSRLEEKKNRIQKTEDKSYIPLTRGTGFPKPRGLKDTLITPLDTLDNKTFTQKNTLAEIKTAIQNRRDYKILLKKAEQNNIEIKQKKNSLLPTLDLTATYATNGIERKHSRAFHESLSGADDEFSFMLSFSIPWENREAKAELDTKNYTKQQIIFDLIKKEKQIITELTNAVNDYNVLIENIKIAKEIVTAEDTKLKYEEKICFNIIKNIDKKVALFSLINQNEKTLNKILDNKIKSISAKKDIEIQYKISRIFYSLLIVFSILFFIIIIVGSLIYILTNIIIVEPIIMLNQTAKEITNTQDFSKKLNFKGASELIDLSNSFNKMMSAINEREHRIEKERNLLIEKEHLLENSLNNMVSAFFLFKVLDDGRDAQLIKCNDKAEEMFYLKKEEVLNKSIFDVLPNVKETGFFDRFINVWKKGTPDLIEQTNYKIQNKNTVIEITVYQIIGGFACIVRDISEKVLMKLKIMHYDKLATIGQMAAGVAHEVGNPLTSISSIIQYLRKQEKNPDKINDLNLVHNNIERINKILKQIVTYSNVPKENISKETVLNDVISGVYSILKYHEKFKGIQLKKELTDTKYTIKLDPQKLEQVLLNISINAADSIKGLNRIGIVKIKTEIKENKFLIIIEDNGKGMDTDTLEQIFEPFFSTKKAGQGSGLGLTISYNIIKSFNGDIDVESTIGKGSKFIISL